MNVVDHTNNFTHTNKSGNGVLVGAYPFPKLMLVLAVLVTPLVLECTPITKNYVYVPP